MIACLQNMFKISSIVGILMLKYIGHYSTVKYAIILTLFQTKNMKMDRIFVTV
jgi:hypothetical protein